MSNVMPFPCPPQPCPPGQQDWWSSGWGHPPSCCCVPQQCCFPQCGCQRMASCAPVVPCPPRPIVGPIIGVTDGSDAAPGQVGEAIVGIGSINYAAYPTNTTTSLALMVIQPGDWSLWPSGSASTVIGGAAFFLDPWPVLGLSSRMEMELSQAGSSPGLAETAVFIGQYARASVSVPTLLAFTVEVFMSGDSSLTTAGVFQVRVEGRRMR